MKASFFARNRKRLARTLPDGALAVFLAGEPLRRTADDFYRFFADRNFVYLTGTDRRGFVLVLEKQGGTVTERLFIGKPDPAAEVWTGKRLTVDEARAASGIETIDFAAGFERYLHGRIRSGAVGSLWLNLDRLNPEQALDPAHALAETVRERYPDVPIRNAYPTLRTMRTVKARDEIAATRKAMAVTREGILAMMRACRPGLMEYELLAEFQAALLRRGILEPAFKPIVSSGPNNFYLHYEDSQDPVRDGDLVLTDVGAMREFCSNDISRVFPANGRFSDRQRAVYSLALGTCDELIGLVKPGVPIDTFGKACRSLLYKGFCDLGLLKADTDDESRASAYMWHGTSHHVGFDVHDVGDYDVPVAKGMIFTMDVGIYIREWGIGMRIEDNVLVTAEGAENLSRDIPRTPDDIERTMAQRRN